MDACSIDVCVPDEDLTSVPGNCAIIIGRHNAQCLCADLDKVIEQLSKGQKETYDKLLEKQKGDEKLKSLTQDQLVKAAEQYGVDVDGAYKYLAETDPDGGDDVAEPNFLTELGKGNKVVSADKKQLKSDVKGAEQEI